ncbi:hypothetical protein ACO11K_003844 [Bacillus cytotoxicus]
MGEKQELTLICVGEKDKLNTLRELVSFQSELIILAANKQIAAEVRKFGFQTIYCFDKELNITSICTGLKKVILLGDDLPTISFFTEWIRFSFQAPITVVTRNKKYPVRLYQTMGASFVVFTNCDNISFLFLE